MQIDRKHRHAGSQKQLRRKRACQNGEQGDPVDQRLNRRASAFQAGGDENYTPTRSRNVIYNVQAVCTKLEDANAVDSVIDGILHNGSMTASGWNATMSIKRETDIKYVNNDGVLAPRYHAGAMYRFIFD